MTSDPKMAHAINLLLEKHKEIGRNPVRADFKPEEVCFIKQKLGPWNRALEAAGLKEAQKITAKEKSRLKRARSVRRRKEAKKEQSIITSDIK